MNRPREKRSIIVVGKTGAGKSSLLNQLIGSRVFRASADIDSCTESIDSHSLRVKAQVYVNGDRSNKREIEYDLTVFDTPGIGDSRGRSRRFLNEIAQTIKTTPLYLIIILVEYGRFDTGFQNYLKVLRECLNGLAQSSTMLIVNKVPTEKYLDGKRRQGEEVRNRNEVMKEMFEKLSLSLGIKLGFKYQLYLENEDNDDAINEARYNYIRGLILSRSSIIDCSRVRTWDQINAFYTRDIRYTENRINEAKADLEDELRKLESDIADVKYSLIEHGPLFNLDLSYLTNVECRITQEEYNTKNVYSGSFNENVMLFFAVNDDATMDDALLWEHFFVSLRQRLDDLDAKRREKRENVENFIQQGMQMLEAKKKDFLQLETTLENSNQLKN
jgi:septin family protein